MRLIKQILIICFLGFLSACSSDSESVNKCLGNDCSAATTPTDPIEPTDPEPTDPDPTPSPVTDTGFGVRNRGMIFTNGSSKFIAVQYDETPSAGEDNIDTIFNIVFPRNVEGLSEDQIEIREENGNFSTKWEIKDLKHRNDKKYEFKLVCSSPCPTVSAENDELILRINRDTIRVREGAGGGNREAFSLRVKLISQEPQVEEIKISEDTLTKYNWPHETTVGVEISVIIEFDRPVKLRRSDLRMTSSSDNSVSQEAVSCDKCDRQGLEAYNKIYKASFRVLPPDTGSNNYSKFYLRDILFNIGSIRDRSGRVVDGFTDGLPPQNSVRNFDKLIIFKKKSDSRVRGSIWTVGPMSEGDRGYLASNPIRRGDAINLGYRYSSEYSEGATTQQKRESIKNALSLDFYSIESSCSVTRGAEGVVRSTSIAINNTLPNCEGLLSVLFDPRSSGLISRQGESHLHDEDGLQQLYIRYLNVDRKAPTWLRDGNDISQKAVTQVKRYKDNRNLFLKLTFSEEVSLDEDKIKFSIQEATGTLQNLKAFDEDLSVERETTRNTLSKIWLAELRITGSVEARLSSIRLDPMAIRDKANNTNEAAINTGTLSIYHREHKTLRAHMSSKFSTSTICDYSQLGSCSDIQPTTADAKAPYVRRIKQNFIPIRVKFNSSEDNLRIILYKDDLKIFPASNYDNSPEANITGFEIRENPERVNDSNEFLVRVTPKENRLRSVEAFRVTVRSDSAPENNLNFTDTFVLPLVYEDPNNRRSGLSFIYDDAPIGDPESNLYTDGSYDVGSEVSNTAGLSEVYADIAVNKLGVIINRSHIKFQSCTQSATNNCLSSGTWLNTDNSAVTVEELRCHEGCRDSEGKAASEGVRTQYRFKITAPDCNSSTIKYYRLRIVANVFRDLLNNQGPSSDWSEEASQKIKCKE